MDSEQLPAPIIPYEIRDAIFDINPNKAPGSDGYGAKFFQGYWPIIEKDIHIAMKASSITVNYHHP